MSSIQSEEAKERREMEKLAAVLGISYDELGRLDLEIVEDSDLDGQVMSVTVYFEEGNPPEIMKKIVNLVDGEVALDPALFHEPADDEAPD